MDPRVGGCTAHPGTKRGLLTGPNPTDRGKPGTKRHLVVDRRGTPLACLLTAANVNDHKVFEELLDAVPLIRQRSGRRRRRPWKVHADKGYDVRACRRALMKRGIRVRIARKGKESRERLGRFRWVVERTFAWLNQLRRLRVRYERRADIHEAFLKLGCSLITWRVVQRFC